MYCLVPDNNGQNAIQHITDFWRREARTDILGFNWMIIKSLHNNSLA